MGQAERKPRARVSEVCLFSIFAPFFPIFAVNPAHRPAKKIQNNQNNQQKVLDKRGRATVFLIETAMFLEIQNGITVLV